MYRVWTKDTQANQEDDVILESKTEARKYTACLLRASRVSGLSVKKVGKGGFTTHTKRDPHPIGFISMGFDS
jgi:hypothetical protein